MSGSPIDLEPRSNNGKAILAQLVGGLSPVVDINRQAMGGGWSIACDLVGLHADVLARLSKAARTDWPLDVQAILLLGTHTFNVFTAAVSGTCRGEFDTTQYFVRAMFDAVSLLSVCAHDSVLAARWRSGDLKAAQARKIFVQALRDGDEQGLADEMGRVLPDNVAAANEAAHVGLTHADKLLNVDDSGVLRPVLGGRPDPALSASYAETFLGLELQALTPLLNSFVGPTDEGELERLAGIERRLRDWRRVAGLFE